MFALGAQLHHGQTTILRERAGCQLTLGFILQLHTTPWLFLSLAIGHQLVMRGSGRWRPTLGNKLCSDN